MAKAKSTIKRSGWSPTAIDLFSGCGGLTEGLRQAGFRVLGAVEINDLACKTYRLNHPQICLWSGDIRNVSVKNVLDVLGIREGQLDLLAGCPPCQGFSAIRTRNGSSDVRDRRNKLTDDFLRFVRGLRPKTIMMENVPGLASKKRFHQFKAALRREGYKIRSEILNAADYGVPQRRRRLILIASKKQLISPAPVAQSKSTVRTAINRLPKPDRAGDPLHATTGIRSKRIQKLIELIPKDGGSRIDLPKTKWLKCHKHFDGFKDVYGRMAWDSVAPTITGGCLNPSKGRFLHPFQDRAITAREAALLQTFPKNYQFCVEKGLYAVAEMIGNALPPEFIRRQALAIKQSLAVKRRTKTGG